YFNWHQESIGEQGVRGEYSLVLLALVLILVIALIIGNDYVLRYLRQRPSDSVGPTVTFPPHGLGPVKTPKGESIGLSDGRVAFDVDPQPPDVRIDSDLKKQAAKQL